MAAPCTSCRHEPNGAHRRDRRWPGRNDGGGAAPASPVPGERARESISPPAGGGCGAVSGRGGRCPKSDALGSRQWDTGEVLFELPFDPAREARYGAAYINVPRGDLHSVLESALVPATIAF